MLAAFVFWLGAALVLIAGAASVLVLRPDAGVSDHLRATLRAVWRARREIVRDPVIRGVLSGVLLAAVPLASGRAIPGVAGLIAAAGLVVAMRRARDTDRRKQLLGWACFFVIWALPSLVFLRP